MEDAQERGIFGRGSLSKRGDVDLGVMLVVWACLLRLKGLDWLVAA